MPQSPPTNTAKLPPRLHIPRLGSLCTGYGGLDRAVQAVFGARLAWCADNDRHVSTILAARHPGVPNLGDLTELDWRQVDPVDILAAGFPCLKTSVTPAAEPASSFKQGTRSGLWLTIAEGIRLLRPQCGRGERCRPASARPRPRTRRLGRPRV